MSGDELGDGDHILSHKSSHPEPFSENNSKNHSSASLIKGNENQVVDVNKPDASESFETPNRSADVVDLNRSDTSDSFTTTNRSTDSLDENSFFPETSKSEEEDSVEDGTGIVESLEESSVISEGEVPEDLCYKQDEDNPIEYLDRELFPTLLPCLEDMLFAAKENIVLKVQKSYFNGLDHLAELLWNRNPLHPERHSSHIPIFEIPFVKAFLEESPRPIYPKSWVWTRDQAAIVIQAAVRGYLVRQQPEVQELRQFWKALTAERKISPKLEISQETLRGRSLASLFASSIV